MVVMLFGLALGGFGAGYYYYGVPEHVIEGRTGSRHVSDAPPGLLLYRILMETGIGVFALGTVGFAAATVPQLCSRMKRSTPGR
jgi:hypothetical protein